jgi:uncharacterized membrane protein
MPATTLDNDLAGDKSRTLSRKLGLWMALGSLGFGLLYLVGLVVNLSTSGAVYPSGSDVRTVSAAVALLWNLALIALFVALRREAEPSRAVLAELALAFAVLVCGVSSVSWFMGLSALPRLVQNVDPTIAGLLDPYNEASPAYALEHLGWGMFFGLATILSGFSLRRRGNSPWIGRSLVLTGVLSLGHFLGVLLASRVLIILGYISWGIAFPLACALLALMLRRRLRDTPQD